MNSVRMTERGFTLVELAIVLIVVGLIVSSVLVGQNMIKAAQIRAGVSQLEKLDAAVNTFRSKFDCLPGDCANATQFNLADPASGCIQNGNGNGVIDASPLPFSAPGTNTEGVHFWLQMNAAGLYAWPPVSPNGVPIGSSACGSANFPSSFYKYFGYLPLFKLGFQAEISVNSSGGKNYYQLAGSSRMGQSEAPACGGSAFFCPSFSPAEASAIDQKMDDGFPMTGKVLASQAYNWNATMSLNNPIAGLPGAAAAVCVDNTQTPNAYNALNISPALCGLNVGAGF